MEMLAAVYWTPGLLERFEDSNGYDLLPYLPLLFSMSNTWNGMLPVYNETYVFGNYTKDGDSIYQLDYRKALNDGYQQYLAHFQQWTHSIGTEYSAQPAYNLPLQAVSFQASNTSLQLTISSLATYLLSMLRKANP